MLKIFRLFCSILIVEAALPQTFSQGNNESVNLLLNPHFDFHSFISHRRRNCGFYFTIQIQTACDLFRRTIRKK